MRLIRISGWIPSDPVGFPFLSRWIALFISSRVGGVEEIVSSLITQELRMYWLDLDLGMPLQERGTTVISTPTI